MPTSPSTTQRNAKKRHIGWSDRRQTHSTAPFHHHPLKRTTSAPPPPNIAVPRCCIRRRHVRAKIPIPAVAGSLAGAATTQSGVVKVWHRWNSDYIAEPWNCDEHRSGFSSFSSTKRSALKSLFVSSLLVQLTLDHVGHRSLLSLHFIAL